jgi:ADP-ribose pyrophosphatase YjhB (NUDIX family)
MADPHAPAAGPIPTVGALLFEPGGEILLVKTHKWSGLYGVPGGKIEPGETLEQALRREIREETALEIDAVRLAMVQDCILHPEFHVPRHFILINFVARALGREVSLNDEAEEYRWVGLRESLALPLNEPTRRLVEHVTRGDLAPRYASDSPK